MIASSHHQFHVWQLLRNDIECVDHQLEALVGAPFSERQNAMFRISPPREVWVLGTGCQNSVRPQMNVIPAIFLVQYFAIARHQNRDGVGSQQHPRRNRSRHAIRALMANTDIFQVHRIHQVMQGNMRITTGNSSQQRSKQPRKSYQRIAAKCAEEQIEPHYVGLQFANRFENAKRTSGIVKGPAPEHREFF